MVFGGMRDSSTDLVWIKDIYCYEKCFLKGSIKIDDELKTARNYLKEMHPKWLNNIENIALNFENDHSCFRHIYVGFGGMRGSTTNLVLINKFIVMRKSFWIKG